MRDLRQKVREEKTRNSHTDEEIHACVRFKIKHLQENYTDKDKWSIESKYYSDEYKSFMKTKANENLYYEKLLADCLLDETNINKFIKGDSKRIHKKSKDFFAVYCRCEGYNDFLSENAKLDIPGWHDEWQHSRQLTEGEDGSKTGKDIPHTNLRTDITVNQHGEQNTHINQINTDNFHL